MKKLFYTIIWFNVLCGAFVNSVYSSELNTLATQKINLVCDNTPLKEVVDSVSEQTGYTIYVEETLLAMTITGKYTELDITPFFQRILRGENISLLFSEKDNTIIVRTFGQKERKYYTAGKDDREDPLTGLKLSEIEALQEEQRKAFLEYSQDPESVDPLIGMKLGDIRESEERQRKIFLENSKNPELIDPLVGKTLGEISNSQDQQRKKFQAVSNDPEAIDSLTGQKFGDIKTSQEQQRQEFMRYSNNPDSVDPLTGLTLGQIKESQERQRIEFLGKSE